MPGAAAHYEQLLQHLPTTELSYLVVAGATRAEVGEVIESGHSPDLAGPQGDEVDTWSIVEVEGGVLAVELSGYGDPTAQALSRLSEAGRAAAVVRDNVQGRLRFGCARNGEVLFDEDEFLFIEDPTRVPSEIRSIFHAVWDGRAEDSESAEAAIAPFAAGMQMAGTFTGLTVTVSDIDHALGGSPGRPDAEEPWSSAEGLLEQGWTLKTRKGTWRLLAPSIPAPNDPHRAVSVRPDGVFLEQPGRAEWDIDVSRRPVNLGSVWNALASWRCGPGEVRLVDRDGADAPRLRAPIVRADQMQITIAARFEIGEIKEMIDAGFFTAYDLMIHIQVLGLTGHPRFE